MKTSLTILKEETNLDENCTHKKIKKPRILIKLADYFKTHRLGKGVNLV